MKSGFLADFQFANFDLCQKSIQRQDPGQKAAQQKLYDLQLTIRVAYLDNYYLKQLQDRQFHDRK